MQLASSASLVTKKKTITVSVEGCNLGDPPHIPGGRNSAR